MLPPRLGQRSDGPFLASRVVSVSGPLAVAMSPILMMPETRCRRSATRLPHWLESCNVPWHSKVILVNPEFHMTALLGFTSLKPILVLGFPSERSCRTPQGRHHPHKAGSLLPCCHYCREGRAARILLSPF